ncbi:hypothetical protein SESBI_14505, partial [Sesbania bispinosa]
ETNQCQVFHNAIKQHAHFSETNSTHTVEPPDLQQTNATRWKPPVSGYYKLNTDVAKLDGTRWGVGAVVRDHEGIVLGAATWQI